MKIERSKTWIRVDIDGDKNKEKNNNRRIVIKEDIEKRKSINIE